MKSLDVVQLQNNLELKTILFETLILTILRINFFYINLRKISYQTNVAIRLVSGHLMQKAAHECQVHSTLKANNYFFRQV